MESSPINILGITFSELTEWLRHHCGKGRFHAKAVFREVFRNGNACFHQCDELSRSKSLSVKLQKHLTVQANPIHQTRKDNDLIKFSSGLEDGLVIESVIIPMPTYSTVCISTQVGCRMGCAFCETGRLGFHRNLNAAEIVSQVYAARFHFNSDIRNVVIMGMGEPLDNFNNVIQAVRVLSDPQGLNIPKSRITLSTVGKADGIRKLACLGWPELKLAVSLNASNNRIRSRLMPVNRSVPMETLREALMEYPLSHRSSIFIEYVLIEGINDTKDCARELADFLRPLKAKINLIPLNPNQSSQFGPPPQETVDRFAVWLRKEGFFANKRFARGHGLLAACGQLGGTELPSNTIPAC